MRDQLSDTLSCVVSQRLVKRANGIGRVPAVEVMTGSPTIKKQIADHESGSELYNTIREGSHYGMNTLNQALQQLIGLGMVTQDDALTSTSNTTELKQMLRSSDNSKGGTISPPSKPR